MLFFVLKRREQDDEEIQVRLFGRVKRNLAAVVKPPEVVQTRFFGQEGK